MAKKRYGDGDLNLPIVGRRFSIIAKLDKVIQNHIKAYLHFQYNRLCMDYKNTKIVEDPYTLHDELALFGFPSCPVANKSKGNPRIKGTYSSFFFIFLSYFFNLHLT